MLLCVVAVCVLLLLCMPVCLLCVFVGGVACVRACVCCCVCLLLLVVAVDGIRVFCCCVCGCVLLCVSLFVFVVVCG